MLLVRLKRGPTSPRLWPSHSFSIGLLPCPRSSVLPRETKVGRALTSWVLLPVLRARQQCYDAGGLSQRQREERVGLIACRARLGAPLGRWVVGRTATRAKHAVYFAGVGQPSSPCPVIPSTAGGHGARLCRASMNIFRMSILRRAVNFRRSCCGKGTHHVQLPHVSGARRWRLGAAMPAPGAAADSAFRRAAPSGWPRTCELPARRCVRARGSSAAWSVPRGAFWGKFRASASCGANIARPHSASPFGAFRTHA